MTYLRRIDPRRKPDDPDQAEVRHALARVHGRDGCSAGISGVRERSAPEPGRPADRLGRAAAVRLQVQKDSKSGWNLHVITERFRFAPERAGQQARPQEGHAHLYLDGTKIARLYGPWYHLAPSAVPRGEHTLTVSLTANDHTAWAVNGKPIQATAGTGETGHHRAEGHPHPASPEAPPTTNPDVSFTVTITGDTVSPTLQRVDVQRGQVVRLEVRSDRENSIHIHGYDLQQPVKPNQPAIFVFTADQTGLFEVEAHHPALQLLQLLVR